jgi:DNA-binding beta-propeller fold protein YncE
VCVGHNPGFLDVNAKTQTLYVPDQNDNTVSVLHADACTAQHRAGCRVAAPTTTVGSAPQGIAADPATDTVYVGNRTDGDLLVIDAIRCNARHRTLLLCRIDGRARASFPPAGPNSTPSRSSDACRPRRSPWCS